MLNLFKKTKAAIQTLTQQPTDVNEIIEKIHYDFDVAGEKLLADAKEVLCSEYDTSKGERLNKLGFRKSVAAVDATTISSLKEESKILAETVEYFRVYYPNYKFITEAEVKKICNKYGLLCALAEYYIGDVPEKNIKEMESFKLRDEDSNKINYGWHKQEPTRGYWIPCFKKVSGAKYGYVVSHRWSYHLEVIADETATHHFEKTDFKICASVKDFDTKEMRIEDGYRLERNLPDPIVLQPVKGGYLIVTKWGLEAKDELAINENQN